MMKVPFVHTSARRLAAVLTLAVASLGAPSAWAGPTGTIKGVVKLKGKAPEAAEISMKSDPFCGKQGPAKDETVVAGKGGELKNVVVRVAQGLKEKVDPKGEVVLDQQGCRYVPRVSVAVAGQQVVIKNSDQTLHNVHTYKGPATLFNSAQPMGFPPLKKTFPKPGDTIKFKCDVHPWMTAWVFVTDNPFAAVTGDDGSFTISDVPAGKYTIEYWHEKYGAKTVDVEVKPGKTAELKLDVEAK